MKGVLPVSVINICKRLISIVAIVSLLLTSEVIADVDADIKALQLDWAETHFRLQGREQLRSFDGLVLRAQTMVDQNPGVVTAWVMNGIINATYANAKGGFGALKYAKAARASFEHSLTLDETAMYAAAFSNLGILYSKVPGRPFGFGDDEKAEELMLRSLTISPENIDTNYVYAEYLMDNNRYEEAKPYLLRAKNAPARPERPVEDSGRRSEIAVAMALLEAKLR